jgi:hypothetical protein
MKNEIEKIQSLLLDHKRLLKEKQDHEQMAEEYRGREEQLVATVDLQDEAQFQTLSNIRLRRELLPAKIRQFEESAVEVEGEIKAACIAAATSILAATKIKADLLRTKFRQALSGFFSGERTNVDDLAEELFDRTDAGTKLTAVEYPCSSTLSITSFDPVERAGKLIEVNAALDQIKV